MKRRYYVAEAVSLDGEFDPFKDLATAVRFAERATVPFVVVTEVGRTEIQRVTGKFKRTDELGEPL